VVIKQNSTAILTYFINTFEETSRATSAQKKRVALGKTRAARALKADDSRNRLLTPETDRGIAFLKHLKTIGDRL
jgi:hypothetical protein